MDTFGHRVTRVTRTGNGGWWHMAATGVRTPAAARGGPTSPAVVRGSAHHSLVLVAAALAVLLSATVLAALAALADRSVEGGVQQRLAGNPRTTVHVMGHYRAQGLERTDAAVRGAYDTVFGAVPHRTYSALRAPASLSSEFTVLRPDGMPRGAGVTLIALPDEARHTRLLSGARPRARTGGPVEAALNRTVAARLGLAPGDLFAINLTREKRLQLKVSGLYAPAADDPGVLDALASTFGTTDSLALLAPDAFTAVPGLTADALAVWTAAPDTAHLRLDQITPLRDRTADFANSDTAVSVFHGAAPTTDGLHADSELPGELDALNAPMAVARAGMYIPGALLAALAAAALVLTARQLARARAAELALMGARGAGAARLVAGAAAHWALVAVPAAVAAPFLAGPLLSGLRRAGVLDGVVPGSAADSVGWTAALLALAVHGAAVLVPTTWQAADPRGGMRLRLRGAKAAAFQRAGTDLVLAAVAVLGWLQLRQYRSPVASGGVSGVSVDPVLILAPVLMTAAATLLSLRLLPLAAPLIDRAARRGAGLVLPLGGWQVGRRAARHAGPALLVTLALAVGALSTTALAILDRGAREQAAFVVGADVRVRPEPDGGRVPPIEQRHSVYAALPGVKAVTPVTDMGLDKGDGPVDVVGVNTAAVAATLRPGADSGPVPALRPDLTDTPAADLLTRLGAAVPEHGFALPGRPTQLPLTVSLSADGTGSKTPVVLTLTVEDADGLPDTVGVPLPVGDGTPYTVRIPLVSADRPAATRQYPLRVTAMTLSMKGAHQQRTYHLTIGQPELAPEGGVWRDRTDSFNGPADAHCPGVKPSLTPADAPVLCTSTRRPGELFHGVLRGPNTGVRYPMWDIGLVPEAARPSQPVPALADDTLRATGQFDTGDVVMLSRSDEVAIKIRVIGRIAAVPGFDRTQGRLLVDSRALAAQLVAQGDQQPTDVFWWLSTRGGDSTVTAAALLADPSLGALTTLPQARAALTDDPLRQGTRGVLLLCLILAPAFALIGFTLHTAMSARLRRREFALLRAIGVRRRQLAALLWTEQLWIALLAVVLGTVLGAALAVVIMPLVTVDDQGLPVYPHLLASVPWPRVALTAAGTGALIVAVVTLLARTLARVDLIRVLRAGDE